MSNIQLRKGVVKNIAYNITCINGYSLNEITFTNNYIADEKKVFLSPQESSGFCAGQEYLYEITHPGKNGKKDWIKANQVVTADIVLEQKDCLIIAQHSMRCAIDLFISDKVISDDVEDDIENIKFIAFKISIATIENAKKLMEVKNYV